MNPVRVLEGRAVPLERSDVDTDQIIPSEWLKRVERTGFGRGLFSEWRDDTDFVLNQPEYAGATILVAGPRFGIGSSREHAVWALMDYGFGAVVAPSFGDIFRQQLLQQGLVIVVLSVTDVEALSYLIKADPTRLVVVDVDQLRVEVPEAGCSSVLSTSIRLRASGCSTDGTTSASPCCASRRSRRSKRPNRRRVSTASLTPRATCAERSSPRRRLRLPFSREPTGDAVSRFPYYDEYEVHRTMPDEGTPREEILAMMSRHGARENVVWEGGDCSGTMYCGDHDHYDFLNEAFANFSYVNTLQRDMCPSATKFEAEVIAMTLDMLGAGVVARLKTRWSRHLGRIGIDRPRRARLSRG